MGKVALHMMKIKSGGVGGIQSHVNREHPPKTNPDIDPSKTAENYDVIRNENFRHAIKDTIDCFATETKTVRKDAVVLCDFIVTSDEQTMKAMSPEKQRVFFEDTVRWFADRYGGENIVFATVHMDETTPHLHLGVVPISEERLSAKTLFDKKELTAIQTEFARDVGEKYGLERGIEGSERKHLSETRYKAQKAAEKLAELERGITTLEAKKSGLESDIEARKGILERLTAAVKELWSSAAGKVIALEAKLQKLEDRLNRALDLMPEQSRRDFVNAWKAAKEQEKPLVQQKAIKPKEKGWER